MRVRGLVVVLALLAVTACGGGDEPEPSASTPAGFELPKGVKLTKPGATAKRGTTQTFVYALGDGASSAVTATVDQVRKGSIKDFQFFNLDAESKAATPYYVTATLTNRGPAGLGAAAPPFVAHDDSDTVYPPNQINGAFRPCATRTLPKSLLPGKKASVCMVFLVPKGRRLVTIDSAATDPADAVRWKP